MHIISQTEGKAKVAVLFSGGIDSSVLTFIAHRCDVHSEMSNFSIYSNLNRHIPLDEPIDLLNVAFENPRKIKLQKEGIYGLPRRNKREKLHSKSEESHEAESMYSVPDRKTGLLELEELRRTCPGRIWNFVWYFMLVIETFHSL